MQGYNEVRASYNPADTPSCSGNEWRAESRTEMEAGTERSVLKLFRKRPLRVPDLPSQPGAKAQYKSLMPMIERLRFGFHR
jgi:hypothetical protein